VPQNPAFVSGGLLGENCFGSNPWLAEGGADSTFPETFAQVWVQYSKVADKIRLCLVRIF